MDHFDEPHKERMAALLRAACALKSAKDDNVPSQIEKGLYLGSVGAANNKTHLKSLNITHILTVASSLPPAYPNDFTYKVVDVPDREDVNIAKFFDDCCGFIKEAKRTGGVLVHCFVGRSRSVTIVVAYLMKKHGMSLSEAMNLVKSKRSVAAPNSGFMLQLRTYAKSLPVMAYFGSDSKHNVCAYLDSTTKNARPYVEIIAFLQRSRIGYAISTRYNAYRIHQLLFWRSAKLVEDGDSRIIKGSIMDQEVTISEDDIRRVLRFGEEPKGLILLNKYLVRGCFMRMKYGGDINATNIRKAHLCPQFKYLMHVLIHCLGSSKVVFDNIRETLQSAMVALVLNRPYNFSAMIFHHLVKNISKKGNAKFLMYPRFLQMIFDDKLPELPKADADRMEFKHMTNTTVNRMGRDDKPPVRRLFGHLLRADYEAPPNEKWKHDDSDSDEENMVNPDDDDDDQGDDRSKQGGDVNVEQRQPQAKLEQPAQQQPQEPVATEQESKQVEIELKETERGKEFENIRVGSRLVSRKRNLESSQGGSSSRQVQDEDIQDADFVPNFADIRVPESTSQPQKRSKAKSSKEKEKIRQRKKKRVKIVTRTPQSKPTMTQPTSTAATHTVNAPSSTAAVQTNVPISQSFASLNQVFGGASTMNVTPSSLPIVTGTQTPVIITFSPLPANVGGESSSTGLPLQEQINNLNNLVKPLMEKCTKNENQITRLTKRNKQLQLTVAKNSERIVILEDEVLNLRTIVEELSS